jgi:hypothetical protein
MPIHSKDKETIVEFARRAMGQADIMANKVIRAIYQGNITLVYPNDNYNKVVQAIKLNDMMAQLQVLRAQ